jgi:ATP-binding cassette subfamily E protein 1
MDSPDKEKVRVAIIDPDRCKPTKCNFECKKYCPVNDQGTKCVDVSKTSKVAEISEYLCIGCGICVKKCPFDAIKIIKIPTSIDSQTVHRFGINGFKLHKLPVPKPGKILGLVGSNGLGKSSAIKILSGNLKPNFGVTEFDKAMKEIAIDEPYVEDQSNPRPRRQDKPIKGTLGQTGIKKFPIDLQDFFKKVRSGEIKSAVKTQYVDLIPKESKGFVYEYLGVNPDSLTAFQTQIIKALDILKLLGRRIEEINGTVELSGGELQRVAIGAVCLNEKSNMFIFDEPSSFLDIKQRMEIAKVIQSILTEKNYIMLIEHDLSILDYLSDYICTLYGDPGLYGVVSAPCTVKEGINVFLDGFIPSENMRFREYALSFKISDNFDDLDIKTSTFNYPSMVKTYDNFKLTISAGAFKTSQVVVLLGENGTGKTTFIKLLAGAIQSDDLNNDEMARLNVSYKPQYINAKFNGTVRELLHKQIGVAHMEPSFNTEITKPLKIEQLLDRNVKELSGGELQRVAIVVCLGKPADIYLIDEPSAYLDAEQRIVVAKLIKRFVMQRQKCCFTIEHDIIMATYLADRIITFDGEPSVNCSMSEPMPAIIGINKFLKTLDVTFRRDNENFRPRINKLNSVKDQEQKLSGNYFSTGN